MPDIHRMQALELISRGLAVMAEDQTRIDVAPKKAEEKEQPITINNYFMGGPDTVEEGEQTGGPDAAKPNKKK